MTNNIRKPDWLKVRFPGGANYARIDRYHRQHGLNSVCRSAACPNQGECWSKGTATFMILGTNCSRQCQFCNVGNGELAPPDPNEPHKIAAAIAELKLRHAVITAVTRDDLPDGGAEQFTQLIAEIRRLSPECRIELLISDLQGDWSALQTITSAKPDILGHNLETVPRLYSKVRPGADYQRSLSLLAQARIQSPELITKSGLMLGMGETEAELIQAMQDLRNQDCQILTLGQYLAPSKQHHPVDSYITPDAFTAYALMGKQLGFQHVESGPLVRSSYHAEEQFNACKTEN